MRLWSRSDAWSDAGVRDFSRLVFSPMTEGSFCVLCLRPLASINAGSQAPDPDAHKILGLVSSAAHLRQDPWPCRNPGLVRA